MNKPIRDQGQFVFPELCDPRVPNRHRGEKITCRTCHALIPDHLVSCPACAERKSKTLLLEQQKLFLPAIMAGGKRITLTHVAEEARWHMALPSVPAYTFCGISTKPGWKRRRTLYAELSYFRICARCQRAFDDLVKEIPQAEEA